MPPRLTTFVGQSAPRALLAVLVTHAYHFSWIGRRGLRAAVLGEQHRAGKHNERDSMLWSRRGTLTMNIQSIPSARGQYESDRLKILAVFSDKRVPELPKVPTMAEAGFPGFVIKSWLGVFGPRGLPDPIRDQLSTVMSEIVKSPAAEAQLRRVGFEPVGMTAADFSRFYVGELQRWQKIANETGVNDVL